MPLRGLNQVSATSHAGGPTTSGEPDRSQLPLRRCSAMFSGSLRVASAKLPPDPSVTCERRLQAALDPANSGGGIRTRDLRVMSPTSYQTAPPRIEDTKYRGGPGGCQPCSQPVPQPSFRTSVDPRTAKLRAPGFPSFNTFGSSGVLLLKPPRVSEESTPEVAPSAHPPTRPFLRLSMPCFRP
jgi:hypothetical protein